MGARRRTTSSRCRRPCRLVRSVPAGSDHESWGEDWAARWTTASAVTSPRAASTEDATSRSASSACTPGRTGGLPGLIRPTISTSGRSACRNSTRCGPTKPLTPVMTTRILSALVVAAVVLAEGGAVLLQGTPPGLVRAVPLDGRPQTLLEGHPRRPAQGPQPRAVEAVAAVVAGAVRHPAEGRLRLAEQAQDAPRQIDVGHLVAAPVVVGFVRGGLLQQPV